MRPFGNSILLLAAQMVFVSAVSAQPAAQFAELEQRLLGANSLSFEFQVTATGAIAVDIEGSLSRTAAGDIALLARGVFAGQDVDLVAIKSGQTLEYGRRDAPVITDSPEALWEALLIGFTRMGILHNIANLSAGTPPDHASGGVADWVRVSNIEKDGEAYSFDIVVDDTPSGSASLAIDESGKPKLRQQTVAFPGGEMRVVESYINILWGE